ncbi:hypothetical protein E3N88_41719 [Mikania micrantha]|uniref:Uncharacterized protein n=1 Tax=Mikania micrantha TaxID=192012 RepID=A0A5N6LJU1_9ASTR|nr:hypothetical protein E3N88_41719 [Mikania micrantha]
MIILIVALRDGAFCQMSRLEGARRGHPPYARLGAAVKNISDPLEATPFCSRIIQAPMKLKKIEETIHDVEVEERMTFPLSDEEQAMDEWMRTNSPELQSEAQSED